MKSPLFTLSEAAAYLRCNPEVLRRWALSKKIRAGKAGKNWRFRLEWLEQFLEENE